MTCVWQSWVPQPMQGIISSKTESFFSRRNACKRKTAWCGSLSLTRDLSQIIRTLRSLLIFCQIRKSPAVSVAFITWILLCYFFQRAVNYRQQLQLSTNSYQEHTVMHDWLSAVGQWGRTLDACLTGIGLFFFFSSFNTLYLSRDLFNKKI